MNVSKSLGKWFFACAWALVLCAGCATTGDKGGLTESAIAASEQAATNSPVVLAALPINGSGINPEVMKVGDYLTIKYDDLPTALPNFDGYIKADGTINLILNQKFVAAGKTPGQLETEIRDRYVPKIFRNMTATVRPVNESRIFYVGGEVRSPGRQMYIPGITVLKAIQSAGYFTDFANQKKVRVTRADGKTSLIMDCKKALKDPSKDMEVYPNDTIIVPRSLY